MLDPDTGEGGDGGGEGSIYSGIETSFLPSAELSGLELPPRWSVLDKGQILVEEEGRSHRTAGGGGQWGDGQGGGGG